jgi:hypothetical protein
MLEEAEQRYTSPSSDPRDSDCPTSLLELYYYLLVSIDFATYPQHHRAESSHFTILLIVRVYMLYTG